MSNGGAWVKIEKPKELRNLKEYFFGEDQSRYILEIDKKNLQNVEKILKNNDNSKDLNCNCLTFI